MPVTQMMTTVGRSSTAGVPGDFLFNGSSITWPAYTFTEPYNLYQPVAFPNGQTSNTYFLDGSAYMASNNLGYIAGVMEINIWFYPTATSCIIMCELDGQGENGGYHYSMLEKSNTTLKATIYSGDALTANGTVNTNQWNHVYLYHNGGSVGVSLNGGTTVTGTATRTPPTATYLNIGAIDATNMGVNARFSGYVDSLVVSTTVVGSNFDATKAKYGF